MKPKITIRASTIRITYHCERVEGETGTTKGSQLKIETIFFVSQFLKHMFVQERAIAPYYAPPITRIPPLTRFLEGKFFIPNVSTPIEKSTKYTIVFNLNSTYLHITRILTPMDAYGNRLWSIEYLTRRFTKYDCQL